MDLVFTKHARTRMLQRNVSEDDIRAAITNADSREETFRERSLLRKRFSRGNLEIVYRWSGGKAIIITCYWLKED